MCYLRLCRVEFSLAQSFASVQHAARTCRDDGVLSAHLLCQPHGAVCSYSLSPIVTQNVPQRCDDQGADYHTHCED